MPTYDYSCNTCGTFEVSQRITEDPLQECPTCGGPTKRLISSTAFVLKGTGWYKTDYCSSGKAAAERTPKSTETKSETAVKTEKPAEKTASSPTSAAGT